MKTANSLKKIVWVAAALIGASCSASPSEGETDLGDAQLFISNVPNGVQCVQITAAGSRTVVKAFPVTPGANADLALNGLALGATVFSGDAFAAACDQVTSATTPDWISTPVSVTISSGTVADVALALRRNGRAQVSVSFEDGELPPDPCSQCIVHPTVITSCNGTCSYACQTGLADCDSDLSNGCETTGTCQPVACHAVVNEVQVAGPAGASDEFVEILNNCTADVPLDGVRLVYRAAAGTTDVVLRDLASFSKLAPGARLLFGGSAYSGTVPTDDRFSNGLAAAGGAIALRTASGIMDSVGYGTATNEFVEGTVAAAPAAGSSIARFPDGTDTNNNAADFKVGAPTPRSANQ